MNHSEGFFKGVRGMEVFRQQWLPKSDAKAVLLVVHGLAEHSSRYLNLVNRFVPSGFAGYAYWEMKWYTGRDSNPQPLGSKPSALSIELPVRSALRFRRTGRQDARLSCRIKRNLTRFRLATTRARTRPGRQFGLVLESDFMFAS